MLNPVMKHTFTHRLNEKPELIHIDPALEYEPYWIVFKNIPAFIDRINMEHPCPITDYVWLGKYDAVKYAFRDGKLIKWHDITRDAMTKIVGDTDDSQMVVANAVYTPKDCYWHLSCGVVIPSDTYGAKFNKLLMLAIREVSTVKDKYL